MNIIVIANGDFPSSPAVLSLLDEADQLVCCDGALEKYLTWFCSQNPRPDHHVSVVGDGDSVTPTLLERARRQGLHCHHHIIAEQESNDLSKAVHYAISEAGNMGAEKEDIRVTLLGATGLREDHTLGNISLLAYYTTHYPQTDFIMVSDHGTFYPFSGRRRFPSVAGQQVSIFSLSPNEPISVTGLRYPIENRCLRWWWEGTLNESVGDSFEVQGGTLIVYILNDRGEVLR